MKKGQKFFIKEAPSNSMIPRPDPIASYLDFIMGNGLFLHFRVEIL
jgi:hypothetical protein